MDACVDAHGEARVNTYVDVCTNMNTDAHAKAYTDMHGDVCVNAIGERKKNDDEVGKGGRQEVVDTGMRLGLQNSFWAAAASGARCPGPYLL